MISEIESILNEHDILKDEVAKESESDMIESIAESESSNLLPENNRLIYFYIKSMKSCAQ